MFSAGETPGLASVQPSHDNLYERAAAVFWTRSSERICYFSSLARSFEAGIPEMHRENVIMMFVAFKMALMQDVPQLRAVRLKVLWTEHG